MCDSVSNWVPVSSGVPQGSVLGPLLFAIFINDLTKVVKAPTKMFADYTKIIGKIRPANFEEDQSLIQDDIKNVAKWRSDWHMYLNIEKFKVMRIGKRAPKILSLTAPKGFANN